MACDSIDEAEVWRRSRGGFTAKLHAVTDASGTPLKCILTGGQASDIGQAEAILADQGYDADALVRQLTARDTEAVIPSRSHRSHPSACDELLYKQRHLTGYFFGKITHYRRVFSRFVKTARNFMGFFTLSPHSSAPGEMSTEPSEPTLIAIIFTGHARGALSTRERTDGSELLPESVDTLAHRKKSEIRLLRVTSRSAAGTRVQYYCCWRLRDSPLKMAITMDREAN